MASPWDALALPPGWSCNKNHDDEGQSYFFLNLLAFDVSPSRALRPLIFGHLVMFHAFDYSGMASRLVVGSVAVQSGMSAQCFSAAAYASGPWALRMRSSTTRTPFDTTTAL